MSRNSHQPKHSGTPLLPRCLVASALVITVSEAAPPDVTGRSNQPKPNQIVSTNTPPASPDTFNPDPNRAQLPEPPPTDFHWTRRVTVSTNSPPAPQFNPDPGASLKTPATGPPSLFHDPEAPPLFTPPAISPGLALPRADVRLGDLLPPPLPSPRSYGSEPLTNGLALPREDTRLEKRIDQEFRAGQYSLDPTNYPASTEPRPDRWRIGFEPWQRYTSGVTEQPYESPDPLLWHPYQQSLLKGDLPVIGQDIFLDMTASAETVTEFRQVPTGSQISSSAAGAYDFFGESEEISIQNNLAFSLNLFQGETVFRPVDWSLFVEPVFNVNYLQTEETGVVSPDPRGVLGGNNNTPPPGNGFVQNPGDIGTLLNGQTGPANSYRGTQSTDRTETFFSLQQAFAEVHLVNLSDNYDFLSLRVGNQPFNADFRGFLFNDVNLGVRLFGNYADNLYQFNLAAFDMREKDTDSQLNTLDARDQDVFIANLYRQDFIWPGYTVEGSFLANYDHGGIHYDDNGNIVRPEPLGTARAHDEEVNYLGWGGDGHVGPFNVSHQFYEAFGHDDFNDLAGRPEEINAQMGALELSYDHDWARYKASFFYASGDGHPTGGHATGFDTIVDNPNFTGGPFSYWARQGLNLGGTLVNLKDSESLVPDLRTSKTEGQANFVNPGVFIYGLGAEFDLTPKLRSFLNANYILFAQTQPLDDALQTAGIHQEVGWDLSLGFQYRPLLTDNIIISAGFGTLLPGRGYRDIYSNGNEPVPGFGSDRSGEVDGFLYSGLIAITFTY
jgi:hypothetical protein